MAGANGQPGQGSRPPNGRLIVQDGALRNHVWSDDDGRTWVSLAPDGVAVLDAWRYPVVGPPAVAEALEAAGWPRTEANAVQEELARGGVLTLRDLKRLGTTEYVIGVVRRALRASVQSVVDAYLLSSAQGQRGE